MVIVHNLDMQLTFSSFSVFFELLLGSRISGSVVVAMRFPLILLKCSENVSAVR